MKVKPTQAREQSRKKYFSFSPPQGFNKMLDVKNNETPGERNTKLIFLCGFLENEGG